MAFHMWWLYAAAVFFVSGTPGPNMLHVMARSIEQGLARTIAVMLGCLIAVLCLLTASATGLAAILLALPRAYLVLKLAGAAYLVWLGIKAWMAPVDDAADDQPAAPAVRTSPLRLFATGYSVGISNPKALLFAAAFFPQFIDPALSSGPQLAIMLGTFAVIETAWYFVYALGGRGLAHWLRVPRRQRLFNRTTGSLFVLFGLAMAGSEA